MIKRISSGALLILLFAFYFFPAAYRVFSLPWMVGRSDVIGWWPISSQWQWIGIAAVGLAVLIPVCLYSVGKSDRTVAIVSLVGAAIALAPFVLSGRARVEVRKDDIRVTSDRFDEPDVIYRIADAEWMTVACGVGRRGKTYPSLHVGFYGGRELELQGLISREVNSGGGRTGLEIAERLSGYLANRGARQLDIIEPECVERTAKRFDRTDRDRVVRLFDVAYAPQPLILVHQSQLRPEEYEVAPPSGAGR